MKKNKTELNSGHSYIFDDLMNERSLENGYVPTSLANPPKFVTKPKGKKDPVPDIVNDSTSGTDRVMPVGNNSNDELIDMDAAVRKVSKKPAPKKVKKATAKKTTKSVVKRATKTSSGFSVPKSASPKQSWSKMPSKANYIPNINPDLVDMWKKDFWTKYGKAILKPTKLDQQWATAIAIWRNYTLKRRVPPFTSNATYLNQNTQDYMLQRIYAGRSALEKTIVPMVHKLMKHGIVRRTFKEKMYEVKYSEAKKSYELITSIKANLEVEFGSAQFVNALKECGCGYNSSFKRYSRSVSGRDIVFMDNGNENSTDILLVQYMNDQHIKFLLGLADDSMLSDKTKIIKKISILLKSILKESQGGAIVIGG